MFTIAGGIILAVIFLAALPYIVLAIVGVTVGSAYAVGGFIGAILTPFYWAYDQLPGVKRSARRARVFAALYPGDCFRERRALVRLDRLRTYQRRNDKPGMITRCQPVPATAHQ